MKIKENLTRQMDIISESSLNRNITIIGAGAIGSATALALCKMGYERITVIDFDKVSIENMNSQMYKFSDIGRFKVESLKDIIKEFANVEINISTGKYEKEKYKDIVICAVDNMKTRKEVYENHKNNYNCNLFIDPRMAIEYAYIQAFNPNIEDQCKMYERTLFSDADAVQERCTNKSTIYTSQLIGATIAKIIKDFTNNKRYINRIQWDIAEDTVLVTTKTG